MSAGVSLFPRVAPDAIVHRENEGMVTHEEKLDRAWDEYKLLANNILKFDSLIFTIKAWSITTFGALLAIYFTKVASETVLLIQIVMSIFYWVLDYVNKRFQSFQITRSRLLDLFLNEEIESEGYRIPDVLFLNSYDSEKEQRILSRRGFIMNEGGHYTQKGMRWKMFFSPQTSLLYLGQIACVIVVLIVF